MVFHWISVLTIEVLMVLTFQNYEKITVSLFIEITKFYFQPLFLKIADQILYIKLENQKTYLVQWSKMYSKIQFKSYKPNGFPTLYGKNGGNWISRAIKSSSFCWILVFSLEVCMVQVQQNRVKLPFLYLQKSKVLFLAQILLKIPAPWVFIGFQF